MAKNKSRKSQANLNRERQLSEALQIAKGIQEEGQTKEQTRAVARGIAKGIALYKKQHKAKARELAKAQRRRETERLSEAAAAARPDSENRGPNRFVIATALAGGFSLAALVLALSADVLAARAIASQLAAGAATPAQFRTLLPDATPSGLLRRGFVLDAMVRCEDARLYYELAGLSFGGRSVLTEPDRLPAFVDHCAVRTRD